MKVNFARQRAEFRGEFLDRITKERYVCAEGTYLVVEAWVFGHHLIWSIETKPPIVAKGANSERYENKGSGRSRTTE